MAKLVVPFRSSRIGDTPRPYIHIEIACPLTFKAVKAVAIVDTGADECAFPKGFADILGFDLDGAEVLTAGTAGGPANSYAQPVNLKAFADGHEILFPKDSVRFMEDLHTPILGVRTFLRYFKFEIDYYERTFSLEPNLHAEALKITSMVQVAYGVDERTLG